MNSLSQRIAAFIMFLGSASVCHALTITHVAQTTMPDTNGDVIGNCISTLSGNTGSNPVTKIIVDCQLKKATVLQTYVSFDDSIGGFDAEYDIQVNAPVVFNCMWCTHNENVFTTASGMTPGNQAAVGPKKCVFAEPLGPPGGGREIP